MKTITNGNEPKTTLSIKPFSEIDPIYIRLGSSDVDIIAASYATAAEIKVYHWRYGSDIKVLVYSADETLISIYWVDAVSIDDDCSDHVTVRDVSMER